MRNKGMERNEGLHARRCCISTEDVRRVSTALPARNSGAQTLDRLTLIIRLIDKDTGFL